MPRRLTAVLSTALALAFAACDESPLAPFAPALRDVSAGATHTCALTTGGAARCRGENGGRQLGNGALTTSTTPHPVLGR